MKRQYPFLPFLLLIAACGTAEDPAEPVEAQQAPAEPVAASPAMPRSASAEGARVFFITPSDGDTVSSPVQIEFGIEGMAVVKAGDNTENSGHHHLIVDAELPGLDLPIPASENYIHFGDGSTSTEIALEPGTHTLQMLLGDHLHIPHDPPLASEQITVTVE